MSGVNKKEESWGGGEKQRNKEGEMTRDVEPVTQSEDRGRNGSLSFNRYQTPKVY